MNTENTENASTERSAMNEENAQNIQEQSIKKEPRWKTESIWHDPATPYYRTTSSGMMFGVKPPDKKKERSYYSSHQDPTADAAIRNVSCEEKRKEREERRMERLSREEAIQEKKDDFFGSLRVLKMELESGDESNEGSEGSEGGEGREGVESCVGGESASAEVDTGKGKVIHIARVRS